MFYKPGTIWMQEQHKSALLTPSLNKNKQTKNRRYKLAKKNKFFYFGATTRVEKLQKLHFLSSCLSVTTIFSM